MNCKCFICEEFEDDSPECSRCGDAMEPVGGTDTGDTEEYTCVDRSCGHRMVVEYAI